MTNGTSLNASCLVKTQFKTTTQENYLSTNENDESQTSFTSLFSNLSESLSSFNTTSEINEITSDNLNHESSKSVESTTTYQLNTTTQNLLRTNNNTDNFNSETSFKTSQFKSTFETNDPSSLTTLTKGNWKTESISINYKEEIYSKLKTFFELNNSKPLILSETIDLLLSNQNIHQINLTELIIEVL